MKKRADGRFSSQIYLGEVDGKRKYKTVYGTTQKEVKQKVAELKIKLGKGVDIYAADETFKTWGDRLISIKEEEDLTAAYIVALKTRFKHLESIYNYPISKITVADMQDLFNRLAKWHDAQKPLAKRTLGSIKELASKIFEYAIIARTIDFNPAKYVVIPKSATSKTRDALTAEQQQWIVETPHRAQRAAMIMLYSGLRRGELLALTWADVNLKKGTITVNKAVEYINGKPRIKKPKTESGNRVVSIPTILVEFLKEEQKKDNCIYVVHTTQGKIFTSSNWKHLWESYMIDLNVKYGYNNEVHKNNPKKIKTMIEPFTAHQLRYTFATLLYLAGTDVLIAKDQLGHANIETTLGIYTHLDQEHKLESVNKLNEYLCKSRASQVKEKTS